MRQTELPDDLGQSLEEAFVLPWRAAGDAQRARPPKRRPRADHDAALREAGDDLEIVAANVEPDEVGLRGGRAQAKVEQARLQLGARGVGGLDATRDLLGMAQRLDRRRLGGSVGEERLADQLERLRQLGRAAQSEADAQAAQAVDLENVRSRTS